MIGVYHFVSQFAHPGCWSDRRLVTNVVTRRIDAGRKALHNFSRFRFSEPQLLLITGVLLPDNHRCTIVPVNRELVEGWERSVYRTVCPLIRVWWHISAKLLSRVF